MTNEGPVHRPQPCRASWNVMFRHGPVVGAVGLRRRARGAPAASPPVRAGVGFGHACLLPGKAKGGTGVSLFCARFACVRAGVGAGAVRAPDCARETAHAPLALAHAGGFFGPQPVAFCRNAERRPRKPPLSLLSSYTIPPNVKLAAKNYFKKCEQSMVSWQRRRAALRLEGGEAVDAGPDRLPSAGKGADRE